MKNKVDVLVIGAGPAGSIAAWRAAQSGFDVLLIEKRQEIGSPLRCAEAIGVDSTIPFIPIDDRWVDSRISQYALVNSRGKSVCLPPTEPTIVVNRKVFDVALARQAAQAGADVQADTAAIGLLMDGKRVVGARVRRHDVEQSIEARLVVAADGTESQVARWGGIDTTPPISDYYLSAEFYCGGIAGEISPETCEYHLDSDLAPGGYCWMFPKGLDVANVGLVVSGDKALNLRALDQLERFVHKRFKKPSVLSVILGGIPVTGVLKQMAVSGLIVVGDAAHMADPLTGGGINLAMSGADLAMQVAIPALKDGDVSAARLRLVEKEWNRKYAKSFDALYKVRKIVSGLPQNQIDDLIETVAGIPKEKLSLGQMMLAALKKNPLLLIQARALTTAGLVQG